MCIYSLRTEWWNKEHKDKYVFSLFSDTHEHTDTVVLLGNYNNPLDVREAYKNIGMIKDAIR